jgi:hypothetical protein
MRNSKRVILLLITLMINSIIFASDSYVSLFDGVHLTITEEGATKAYLTNNNADDGLLSVPTGCTLTAWSESALIDFVASGEGNINYDGALPVTLSSFTASFSNGSSLLSWTTQSESNNLGWNVYRGETENVEDYLQINNEMIGGAGTTTEQTDYTFADQNETYANTSYWYWIESVDYGGYTNLHGPARIDIPDDEDELPPELLTSYGLAQNFPNPFNPNTKIAFRITDADTKNAKLIIYNPKGQIVKIFDDLTTNGDELGSVTWNGDDNNDIAVSSGMYFYKLITDEKVYSKKMIMMK